MKLIDSFRRSAAQLRDLRSLTGASLLLALSILLTYFFRLDFGGSLSVGLSFNATALMGMLFLDRWSPALPMAWGTSSNVSSSLRVPISSATLLMPCWQV